MNKAHLVFAGQGSKFVGMGPDFDDQLPVDPDTNPETITNPENIAQFVNRKTREWLIENVKAYNAKVAAAAARDAALSAVDFDITDPQL